MSESFIRDFCKERWGDDVSHIVLIGSRARGDHRPDSDWDVVVVVKDYRFRLHETNGPVIVHQPRNADGQTIEIMPINPADADALEFREICDMKRDGVQLYP